MNSTVAYTIPFPPRELYQPLPEKELLINKGKTNDKKNDSFLLNYNISTSSKQTSKIIYH